MAGNSIEDPVHTDGVEKDNHPSLVGPLGGEFVGLDEIWDGSFDRFGHEREPGLGDGPVSDVIPERRVRY